jgi:hypothetical protein
LDGGGQFQFGNRYCRILFLHSDGDIDENSLSLTDVIRGMLQVMQATIPNQQSSTSPSFAGLLASLAAPAPKTAWNNDDLADDVATLSYEHALLAHTRYRSNQPDESALGFAGPPAVGTEKVIRDVEEPGLFESQSRLPSSAERESAAAPVIQDSTTALEMNKKCASITIRLSKAECDQLRRRAAQAGLTVSAYLRSCTFEAEALRAQVKDVLAELRQTASSSETAVPRLSKRSWFDWLWRLIPRRQREHGFVQA